MDGYGLDVTDDDINLHPAFVDDVKAMARAKLGEEAAGFIRFFLE